MVIRLDEERPLVEEKPDVDRNKMRTRKRKSFGGESPEKGNHSGKHVLEHVVGGIAKRIKAKKNKRATKDVTNNATEDAGGKMDSPCLSGMSAAEAIMIRRLAGNDADVRKKTMRKLRKWLSAMVVRYPADSESRLEIEPNVIRVWKALFYCMWMADKPLPQEQLAEQISSIVHVVSLKPNVFLIFVEWFFRTMAREWSWIDRYRLDKFMMLIRRVLRQSLSAMCNRKFNEDMMAGFLKIVKNYIFNHEEGQQKKTQWFTEDNATSFVQCPVGLQLHFIDIFLEELAKAGAEKLKTSVAINFLTPFIDEMGGNSDDRVTKAISERIFLHLMRQSDVGIEYEESLLPEAESEDDEEEEMVEDEDEAEEDNNANVEETLENDFQRGPLDPRAGGVDVTLPQLPIDYSDLSERLIAAGSVKNVKKSNRANLLSLANSFKDLVEGTYPLALPSMEKRKGAISKRELEKATHSLIELTSSQSEDGQKKRGNKKQRRRAAKRLQQQEQLDDTIGSEDSSAYLNDSDFMEKLDDNYDSYMNEQMDKSPEDDAVDSQKKKKKKRLSSDGKKKNSSTPEVQQPSKKKRKYNAVIEFEADELTEHQELSVSVEESPPKSQVNDSILVKKKRRSLNSTFSNMTSVTEQTIKIQRRQCHSLSPNSSVKLKHSPSPSPPHLFSNQIRHQRFSLESNNGSPPILSPIKNMYLKTKLGIGTPGSNGKKKINFVLKNNLEHEASDYMPSISKSPAIPFDAQKTPRSGILKTSRGKHSTNNTPNTPTTGNKLLGFSRRKAMDFF